MSSSVRTLALGLAAAGCAALAGLDEPPPSAQTEDEVTPPSKPKPAPPPPTPTKSCAPAVDPAPTDGKLHAALWEGPEPTIDGAFDDWACIARTELGRGVFTTTKFPESTDARLAFRWTRDALYFYASIETTMPGFEMVDGFANDSINLYIGAPNPGMTYRATDHQFSFDHLGRVSHYVGGQRRAMPPTIQPSMRATKSDPKLFFEVEAKIDPALIGAQSFEKGQRYTLGLQIHDRLVETGGVEWRAWFRGPACGCNTTSGCCSAATGNKNLTACDLRCTGELVLD